MAVERVEVRKGPAGIEVITFSRGLSGRVVRSGGQLKLTDSRQERQALVRALVQSEGADS